MLETLNFHFWICYIMCLLPRVFNSFFCCCCVQVLDRFFKVGQEKSGMLNLVIARLCQLWSEPDGIALATRMVPTIVDACMFGTLHKKTERWRNFFFDCYYLFSSFFFGGVFFQNYKSLHTVCLPYIFWRKKSWTDLCFFLYLSKRKEKKCW